MGSRSVPESGRDRNPLPGCSGANPQAPPCPQQPCPNGLAPTLDATHTSVGCTLLVSFKQTFQSPKHQLLLPAGPALDIMKSHLLFKDMDPVPLLTPFHRASKPPELLEAPHNLWQRWKHEISHTLHSAPPGVWELTAQRDSG